jgi:ketosteroid isomerase-like protein
MEAASALLLRTADALDAAPGADHTCSLAAVRCAVERATREVVERVPRMVGAAALSRDGDLAQALADLSLYIRQHQGERDHEALGASVLAMRTAR